MAAQVGGLKPAHIRSYLIRYKIYSIYYILDASVRPEIQCHI